MANFQFTVRATDSDGAYADRNFAITINNTRVERYMVIDNANAYTSPDLVNWSTRNGQGGGDVAYGNSMWLIISTSYTTLTFVGGQAQLGSQSFGTNSFVVRKSPDGVNFSTMIQSALTFLKADGTAFVPPSTNMVNGHLSFSNGFFWLPMSWGSQYGTGANYTQYIARSPDGVTWTMLNTPQKGTFNYDSTYGHHFRTFARVQDSGSDLFINNWGGGGTGITATQYGWKSSDLGLTWTPVTDSTGKVNGNTNIYSANVQRINGLYLASTNVTPNVPFMISNDGFNWSPCNAITAGWSTNYNVANVVYANGTLYAIASYPSVGGTTSTPILTSTDGLNWTNTSPTYSNQATTATIQSHPTLIYKNGYVITGQSAMSTTYRPLGYLFAGSTDPWTFPNGPTTGSTIPFGHVNGVAAMGS